MQLIISPYRQKIALRIQPQVPIDMVNVPIKPERGMQKKIMKPPCYIAMYMSRYLCMLAYTY